MGSVEVGENLPPFRMSKEDIVELVRLISDRCQDTESLHIKLGHVAFRSTGAIDIESIERFLADTHLPTVTSDFSLYHYGSPALSIYASSTSATCRIEASSMAHVAVMKDTVRSFFERHSIHPLAGGKYMFFWSFGSFLAGFSLVSWASGRLINELPIEYPYLYFFIMVLLFALAFYGFSSILVDRPQTFSLVHSLIYIGDRRGSPFWTFIVKSIVVDLIVSLVAYVLLLRG